MKHARDREMRHNLSVTLNLSHTACAPGEASSVMQRLVKDRFGRWLRHKSQKAEMSGQPSYGSPAYT